jgi:hypothetical protein
MAAMTKTYLVTGVGCRRREETFVVPEGVQIIFYRTRPRPPRIAVVRSPADELAVALKLLPAKAAGPGDFVSAAYCWQRSPGGPPSGVYRRSGGARMLELSNTSPRRPVSLSHIVRELTGDRGGRPTVFHWLVDPADPAPGRPHWQLQHPSLVMPGDGDESAHVPLDEAVDDVPPGWVTVSVPGPR